MGACFLYLANNIDDLLPETGKPNILKLVCVLFLAKIMAATQDIAVDGWALTMLRKNNVGYASTCNATGQVMGIMIGSVFTVLFTSEDFCNKYLRFTNGTGGIVSMKSLFYAWGIMFIIITSLIAIFKKEKDNRLEENYVKLNVIQNYLLLWDILKLPSIQIFALTLLTAKIGFAATDNVSILKLIDAGVSKDDIMIINTAMFVIKAIIPLIVGKYTSGPKPMTIYLNIAPFRLLWNISFVALIYYTPKIIKHNGVIDIPIYYYVILVFIVAVHDMLSNIMIIATLAFFSRISDSRFGGTYMTLLNTLTNIGGAWTQSVSLGLVDLLSFNECTNNVKNDCSTLSLQSTCKINGGQCVDVNGYYVETAMCTILGVIWLSIFGKILKKLQTRSLSSWLVNVKPPVKENNKDICNLTVMS
jgi:PAT family acetyl-CoA transporter-like MFS transporter 1